MRDCTATGGGAKGGLKMAAAALPFRGVLLRAQRVPVGAARFLAGRSHGEKAAASTGEPVTHTGQVFEESDYRQVRFVGRQKEVNESFAIDLIAEQPVTEVETRVVACNGGGGALGHPKVYINLDKDTKTGTCGYCGLQFRQKHHH